jgi:ABC-type nitrate/sulfonate/bicarbonate transport system substrate-binding protein
VPLPGLFELVGALKNGDIDASWLWANAVAEALQDQDLAQVTDDSAVLDATSISLVAGRQWTEEHPDEVRRVLTAFADAAEFVAADPDATGQIVADAVQGDAAQIASITPGQGWGLGFDQAQLDNLDALAGFLVDSGKLDADFDVRGFLNLDLMEEVAPGSVTADLG